MLDPRPPLAHAAQVVGDRDAEDLTAFIGDSETSATTSGSKVIVFSAVAAIFPLGSIIDVMTSSDPRGGHERRTASLSNT
jgi:hypothetical protein